MTTLVYSSKKQILSKIINYHLKKSVRERKVVNVHILACGFAIYIQGGEWSVFQPLLAIPIHSPN